MKEITVGLTIVRPRDAVAASHEAAKLLPAVAQDLVMQDKDTPPAEKRSDLTVLLHMKGTTASLATTIYREKFDANLDDKQDWHWAIIEAKGIPPSTIETDLNTYLPRKRLHKVEPARSSRESLMLRDVVFMTGRMVIHIER